MEKHLAVIGAVYGEGEANGSWRIAEAGRLSRGTEARLEEEFAGENGR